MEEEVKKIDLAIKQAAASIWLDNLPLSKEYVEKYREEKINKYNNCKKYVLRRGIKNVKRR